MAQFNFYGSWEDSLGLIETLRRTGLYTFVVDMWYAEKVPLQFTELTDDIRGILEKRRRVWLWSKNYSRFAPQFSPPTSRGLMMIDPAECGPALDLSLPACYEEEGRIHLAPGDLFYEPQYHDPETGEWYKPPEALKEDYKQIRALLCKQMQRWYAASRVAREGNFVPTIETLWMGTGAADLLQSNRAEILINGDWRKGADLSRSRSEAPPYEEE